MPPSGTGLQCDVGRCTCWERCSGSRPRGRSSGTVHDRFLSSRSTATPPTCPEPKPPPRSDRNPTPACRAPREAMTLVSLCSASQTRTTCAASNKPVARPSGLVRRVLRPPPAPAAQTEAPPPKERQAEVRVRLQATAGEQVAQVAAGGALRNCLCCGFTTGDHA